MTTLERFKPSGLVFAALVAGCGGADGRDQDDTFSGAGISVSAGASVGMSDTEGDEDEDDGEDDDDTADSDRLDVAPEDDSSSDTNDDCAEVSDMATVGPQPADIILVIDNSGSMTAEASFVQQQMNTFSTQIIAANIDVHVVVISAYPTDDAGVCIEPPLGSGGCPAADTNLPGFLHVNSGIGSNNALSQTVGLYDQYKDVLRPTAALHLIVVTDDDSDMGAADFLTQFNALIPNPTDFRVHAIAADESPVSACFTSNSCCLTSADEGKVYKDLIGQTGGVYGNLCDQEFQPIFQEVATVVIQESTLACEFAIPAPPGDAEFDRDEVNVEFDDGNGNILQIGRVETAAECAGVSDGWYYDDPVTPTQIVVCPQTCDKIQGFESASIAIKFGCATIPAG